MCLNGQTTVVGIFGDPVKHSLSPKMQNAAIKAAGLNAVYVPFHVTTTQLSDAIKGIRAMGIRGVNLTIPHKESAISLVDELDEQAELIGAVNTVVNNNGVLKGYNTDGHGLLKALQETLKVSLQNKKVLLIGAGGACRAALVALCLAGVSWVGVANRTRSRAQDLVADYRHKFTGTTFADFGLTDDLQTAFSDKVDVLINTSSVGLHGEAFDTSLLGSVRDGGAVYDMVYSSGPTPLVSEALEAGLFAADGKYMLAGQGEVAFEHWFGLAPERGSMCRSLVEGD